MTTAVLVNEFAPPGQPHILTTGRTAVRLSGAQPQGLVTLVAYDVLPTDPSPRVSWVARVVGYAHELRSADDRMILAFHWHPSGRSPVTWPHLHLGVSIAAVDLSKAHVPTGVVTLQAVVRFAIVDCGVRPLRDDWDAVLTQPIGDPRP